MNKNVGPLDARVRIGVGVLVAVLTLLSVLGYTTLPLMSDLGFGILAGVLIVEGAMGRCLLYGLLGIDRCPVD